MSREFETCSNANAMAYQAEETLRKDCVLLGQE
jgi:hypothetical protein